MANQDLNRLFENLHQAREVFVTDDGQIEDAPTAEQNVQAEQAGVARPKERTRLKPERWGAEVARPAVRVTLSALNAMHEEAARHPGESGGILVGPDALTVSEFIPSGPDASRTSGSYELDVAYLQPRLDEAQDRGLLFVGVFHSHPARCRTLSALDLETACSIVADPDWCAPSLVLPLAVRYRGGFETAFYIFSKGMTRPEPAELRLLAETPGSAPASKPVSPPATGVPAGTPGAREAQATDVAAATTAAPPAAAPPLLRRPLSRLTTRRGGVRARLVRLLRGLR